MKIKNPKIFENGLKEGSEVFMGIDQSYSGFAIAMIFESSYRVEVYKSEFRGTERLKDIRNYMLDTILNYKVLDVAMEGYAYNVQMAHMAGELGGMVKLTLLNDFGILPLIVAPAALKKYVTGKGTGVQKNQMLLNVYKTWGIEFTDDNAADAYALAKLASGASEKAYQREVLEKLQDPKFRNV